MKLKRIIISIYLLILSLILTSCDYISIGSRQINDLGIVIATAIDIDSDTEEIILTHEVIIPGGSGKSQTKTESKVIYVQSRGVTVFDAMRNVTLTFDRKLFLAHNRVLVMGDEFARGGITDSISFYTYDNEIRESTYMVVAKDAKAYEILGVNGGLDDTPGNYLSSLLENSKFNEKSRIYTANDFFKFYIEHGNPVTAVVSKIEKPEIHKDGVVKASTEALDVSGGAVFKKDKLVGYYNAEEMKGFKFLVNEFENGLIIFETPDELVDRSKAVGSRGKYTTVESKSSHTKKKIELKDGRLHLTIDVKLKGTFAENTMGLDIVDNVVRHGVELACSNKIKEDIMMTLEKAQKELKVDSFSIRDLVHAAYPDLWKGIEDKWEGIFPDISYTINVKTDLIKTGLINTPINIRKVNE